MLFHIGSVVMAPNFYVFQYSRGQLAVKTVEKIPSSKRNDQKLKICVVKLFYTGSLILASFFNLFE